MRAVDIIIKKRDKLELTDAEIDFFRARIYKWSDSRLSGFGLGDGNFAQWDDCA